MGKMGKVETTKPRQAKNKKLMLVRYGQMGLLGWFEHQESEIPKLHKRVMIKTNRGLELGDIVGPFCYRGGQFRMGCEQVAEYFGQEQAEQVITKGGRFIRYATQEDINDERHLVRGVKEEIKSCQQFADELDLPMRVVDGEHIFGGERIVFYFIADGRVDFRELVKKLAKEYQTRIEMRQIGSRDQARLVADYETCGLQCCCKRFLKILKPVNMKMAKLQKATLDPAKISGHCGRLKCCLRYEDETYRELEKRLPKRNTRVNTAHGLGKIVDVQLMTQLVVVQTDNGTRFAVPVEELEIISVPAEAKSSKEQEPEHTIADSNNQDRDAKQAEQGQNADSQRQDNDT